MQKYKKYLYFIILAFFLWLALKYRHDIYLSLRNHPQEIFSAIFLGCIFITIQAFNFLQLLNVEVKPPLSSTLHTWALANLTNYLGPLQPGLLIRFGFFKDYGIGLKRVAATTLLQLYLSVWTGLAIAASAMFFNTDGYIRQGWIIFAGLFAIFPFLFRLSLRLYQRLKNNSDSVSSFEKSKSTFPLLQFNKLWPFPIQYALMSLNLFIVYNGFQAGLSIQNSLIFAFFMTLSSLFVLLPNNLGIQELFFVVTARLVGVSSLDSITIAFIYRLAHIVACTILLFITMPFYNKNSKIIERYTNNGGH